MLNTRIIGECSLLLILYLSSTLLLPSLYLFVLSDNGPGTNQKAGLQVLERVLAVEFSRESRSLITGKESIEETYR